MESSLFPTSPLCEQNISRNAYAVSLLGEGLRCGLTTDTDVARVQTGQLLLMQRLVERFTRGLSTSVRSDRAHGILHSNLFSIDVALLDEGDHEKALQRLLREDAYILWKRGQAIIGEQVELCRRMYARAKETHLAVPLRAYNDSLEGIGMFFSAYDPVFAAHEAPVDIDYPLFVDDQSLRGVFYVRQYLCHLLCENEFCGAFSRSDWDQLLGGYAEQYQTSGDQLVLNLFECALIQSVLSVSLHQTPRLVVQPGERDYLQKRLGVLGPQALGSWLDGALGDLSRAAKISPDCAAYLSAAKAEFFRLLFKALSQNTLDRFAVAPSRAQPTKIDVIEQRMDDKSFRVVFSRLQRMDSEIEKAKFLRETIRSRADLLDILRSGALSFDDCVAFYHALSDFELSLLARAVFPAELRTLTRENLRKRLDSVGKTAEPYESALLAVLCSLDSARLRALENAIESP